MEKMDKRALAKIPRPEVTERMVQIFQESERKTGIVTAQWMKKKSGLIVNVFKADPHDFLVPLYRIFCKLDGDITQDLTTEKTKWKTASYQYINDEPFYYSFGCTFTAYTIATEDDNRRISEWFELYKKKRNPDLHSPGNRFNDYLYAYQNDIRDRRRVERNQAKLDAIDQRMSRYGNLPDDYQKFVDDKVFGDTHFLFYSKKKKFAYCTHCNQSWTADAERQMEEAGLVWNLPIKVLRHNEYALCPMCGHEVMAKSEGMGRGKMIFVKWSVLAQASGEDVLVRYIRHIKDFREDYKNPKSSTTELFRSFHGPEGQENYEWGRSLITMTERWGNPRTRYFFPSEFSWPYTTILYNTDFGFLRNTRMRYSCIDLFIDNLKDKLHESSPWDVDRWFNFYHAYPYMEQFMKLGWYKLVNELMHSGSSMPALKRMTKGKTVSQTLGVPKERFLYLREATHNDPKIIDLQIMWHAQEIGLRLSPKDHRELRCITSDAGGHIYRDLVDLCVHTTPHKLVSWIRRQNPFKISDYLDDYIKWCRELKVNLDDEYNLLPPNFYDRHDALYLEYLAMTDKKRHQEIMEYNNFLAKMRADVTDGNPQNMHLEGLFVRLPIRLEELDKEGEVLHHCVGSYKQRVIDKKTMIFFIRKESEPDTPFYTLEWYDHKVKQCRGLRNSDPTPDVKAFTELFEEKMLVYEGIKKPRKTAKVV